MRTFLVLAIALAASTRAQAAQIVCHKTSERVGGLKKTYYYDHCPSWTVRWRLNRDSQFGPRPRTRKNA